MTPTVSETVSKKRGRPRHAYLEFARQHLPQSVVPLNGCARTQDNARWEFRGLGPLVRLLESGDRSCAWLFSEDHDADKKPLRRTVLVALGRLAYEVDDDAALHAARLICSRQLVARAAVAYVNVIRALNRDCRKAAAKP